jgi:hypothetical protein
MTTALEALEVKLASIPVTPHVRFQSGRLVRVKGHDRKAVLTARIVKAITETAGKTEAEKGELMPAINEMLEEWATLKPSGHDKSEVLKAFTVVAKAQGLHRYHGIFTDIGNLIKGLPTKRSVRKAYD